MNWSSNWEAMILKLLSMTARIGWRGKLNQVLNFKIIFGRSANTNYWCVGKNLHEWHGSHPKRRVVGLFAGFFFYYYYRKIKGCFIQNEQRPAGAVTQSLLILCYEKRTTTYKRVAGKVVPSKLGEILSSESRGMGRCWVC